MRGTNMSIKFKDCFKFTYFRNGLGFDSRRAHKGLTVPFKTVLAPVAQLVERRAYRKYSMLMTRESRGFETRREHQGLVVSPCKNNASNFLTELAQW